MTMMGPGDECDYDAAMAVTDQAAADALFEKLVSDCIEATGMCCTDAEVMQRENLAYHAGYYDRETRDRVERLFRCAHPVFGSIAENGPPTPEQAWASGVAAGEAMSPGLKDWPAIAADVVRRMREGKS
jgi:hypothetical protein